MSAWTVLGLKRTDDIAEIRRAYARKLKATDVDADPAAFIALRGAFERALADAQARLHRQAPAMAGDEPAPDAPIETLIDAIPAATPAPAPELETPAGEDPNARFVALEHLLFPGEDAPPPDPDALAGAVRDVIDHPDMDQVDRSANVEMWLAEALYDSIPRSDPVIAMVIDHFHWDRKAGHWDQPWLFEELVKRRNAFILLDALALRSHPLHGAWRDLTSDKESLGLKPIGRTNDVAKLLQTIREKAPAAEAWLNPYRVGLWDERLNRSVQFRLRWVWLVCWALFILAKCVSAFNAPTPTSSISSSYGVRPSLSDPAVDLNPILSSLSDGQLEMIGLRASNPRLYAQLEDAWQRAHDRGDGGISLDGDVAALLENFYRDSIRAAPVSIQADYWRLKVDQLNWLRDHGTRSCEQGFQDQGSSNGHVFPLEMQDRRRAIRLAVWRSVAEEPPPHQASVTIPGEVTAEAARRAHLDMTSFRAAMRGNASEENVCAAEIALGETALARPPAESARLLRDLTLLE